jgi:trimethylamine:corrinoid methyltransferase-like protein
LISGRPSCFHREPRKHPPKEGFVMYVRPRITMLAEREVRMIHEASLEVLQRTGVLMEAAV